MQTIELIICADCAMYSANRDLSGASTEFVEWIESGDGAEALRHVVVESGTYDFVPRPCETCDGLPGARYDATAIYWEGAL